jgi:hypothetical protein
LCAKRFAAGLAPAAFAADHAIVDEKAARIAIAEIATD